MGRGRRRRPHGDSQPTTRDRCNCSGPFGTIRQNPVDTSNWTYRKIQIGGAKSLRTGSGWNEVSIQRPVCQSNSAAHLSLTMNIAESRIIVRIGPRSKRMCHRSPGSPRPEIWRSPFIISSRENTSSHKFSILPCLPLRRGIRRNWTSAYGARPRCQESRMERVEKENRPVNGPV